MKGMFPGQPSGDGAQWMMLLKFLPLLPVSSVLVKSKMVSLQPWSITRDRMGHSRLAGASFPYTAVPTCLRQEREGFCMARSVLGLSTEAASETAPEWQQQQRWFGECVPPPMGAGVEKQPPGTALAALLMGLALAQGFSILFNGPTPASSVKHCSPTLLMAFLQR